jgi:hypothetical protein
MQCHCARKLVGHMHPQQHAILTTRVNFGGHCRRLATPSVTECTHAWRSHSRCCQDRDHSAATATRSTSAPSTTATPANASSRMDHARVQCIQKSNVHAACAHALHAAHLPSHSVQSACVTSTAIFLHTLSAAPVAARLLLRHRKPFVADT